MKARWMGLLTALLTTLAMAAPRAGRELPGGPGPWVIQAHYEQQAQLETLARDFDLWDVDPAMGYARLYVDRAQLRRLLDLGLRIAVDAPATRVLSERPRIGAKTISGYSCYRTVAETSNALARMVRNHPNLARREVIGESWATRIDQGAPLEVLVLGRQDGLRRPALFVSAAVHAREYATAELVTRFAEYLLDNRHSDADAGWLLDHREIHLLLMSNPDGRRHAQQGVLWRKNVNDAHCPGASPGQGVDLNRNFVFGWGQFDGSSGTACDETFRGAGPESEPETRALADYLQQLFGDHRPADLVSRSDPSTPGVFLDVHSYGRLVLWPWGFPGVSVPDGDLLEVFARRLAWFNRYRPQQDIYLYPTDGTTTQFAYGELGIASATFELGDTFFEPCHGLGAIVEGNFPALIYAARVADAPYQRAQGPNVAELLVLPGTLAPGEPLQLQLRGDDGQVSRLGGTAPDHLVTGFDIRLEALAGGTPALVRERSVEATGSTRVSLDTANLGLGRYRVNVRAIDETGAVGPWESEFLDVLDPGDTGVVVGSLRSADRNLPLAGRIQLGDQAAVSDPASGAFRLRLSPGDRQGRAEADGHEARELAQVVTEAGRTRPLITRLEPLCEIFAEDAESGLPGWTGSGTWGVTDEAAAEGNFSLTDSPGGNYAAGLNQVLSPAFDLDDAQEARLAFSYRCNTESQADFGRIQVRRGQGVPRTVFECSGDSGDWQRREVSLDDFLGISDLKLNIHLQADAATHDDGFYLDDIRILARRETPCPSAINDGFAFSGDLSGTWYDPALPGQGFVVEVGRNDAGPVLVVSWYSYEDGEPLWLIGSTAIGSADTSATLELYRASGNHFGTAFDPASLELQAWGSLELAFRATDAAAVSYRRASDEQTGSFELERLTAGLDPGPAPGLAGLMSGTWLEPGRPGQGLTVELAINSAGPVAIVTWYTFEDGRPLWLIGSAPFEPAAGSLSVPVQSFRGTGFGAAFDPSAIEAEDRGELELAFPACGTLELAYRIGDSEDRMVLARLTRGLAGLECTSLPNSGR